MTQPDQLAQGSRGVKMLQLAMACLGFSQPTGRRQGTVEVGWTDVVRDFSAKRNPRVKHTLVLSHTSTQPESGSQFERPRHVGPDPNAIKVCSMGCRGQQWLSYQADVGCTVTVHQTAVPT